jgi:CrcB protein
MPAESADTIVRREEEPTMTYLIVFLGGGIGAALRHGVNIASARYFGTAFPFATMIENVSGSLIMGLLAGYFAFRSGADISTGNCPHHRNSRRLTTFSAFSLDGCCCMSAARWTGDTLVGVLAIAGCLAGPGATDILIQTCRVGKGALRTHQTIHVQAAAPCPPNATPRTIMVGTALYRYAWRGGYALIAPLPTLRTLS